MSASNGSRAHPLRTGEQTHSLAATGVGKDRRLGLLSAKSTRRNPNSSSAASAMWRIETTRCGD